ncbi:MAG: PadR family transcriptional regulator [Aeromicrobium sp.]|jgi:DNA-binding PadR family transcriptional regulator|nr:MAG: PadR family transcriptional regulator [Aeromicrobium sp.]
MQGEQEEFAAEVVARWRETHKKSMTVFFILVALNTDPMWSRELATWLVNTTGIELTERGLHRTLQRMHKSGFTSVSTETSPVSGADRKVYTITPLGRSVAQKIKQEGLDYVFSPAYQTGLERL